MDDRIKGLFSAGKINQKLLCRQKPRPYLCGLKNKRVSAQKQDLPGDVRKP